ncbi:MAG TPA: protein kinase, partial [Blastocatellia bacterium]|nr:protein kinase [Blastocatellia bacterium]
IYVAMEYLEGRNLREVLSERGPLPMEMILSITRQVCAGLAAAHKLGIVHRDIKPDNIMLIQDEESLRVKVLDFGIARLSEPDATGAKTRAGAVFGTPAYMSPEQAAGLTGEQIDLRADVYSLGMVIYEMLTGRVAFDSESWMGILHHQIQTPPVPPGRLCPELKIPEAVERVILKALDKIPARRQQTILELAAELDAAGRPPRVRDSRPAPAPTVTAAPAPRSWKREKLILAGLLVGLTILMLVFFLNPRPASPEQPLVNALPAPPVDLPVDLLEYRVERERPGADLESLVLNQIVRSGESIRFRVKAESAGAFYALGKNDDGSMFWIDAADDYATRINPAGEWVPIPRKTYLEIGNEVGTETVLLIFVPRTIDWTLARGVSRGRLPIKDGLARIPPDGAARLMKSLRQEGLELQSGGPLRGETVSFKLTQAEAAERIAFYEIKLTHVSKD